MKKIKILTILVVGLLISNLILAGFILFSKPKHPGIDGPRNHIISKLNFSEEQIEKYDMLIKVHREDIIKAEQEIMNLKNDLYVLLKGIDNSMAKDSIIESIANVQTRIENTHYDHFLDIKELCDTEQQQAFSELTQEVAALFAHPRPKDNKK